MQTTYLLFELSVVNLKEYKCCLVAPLYELDLDVELDCCCIRTRITFVAGMLLFDSLFVAVGCFLLAASNRKQKNLTDPLVMWLKADPARACVEALQDVRSAEILKNFTNMCLNLTGPYGISPTGISTWNGSMNKQPTQEELDGFLLAIRQWNQTLAESTESLKAFLFGHILKRGKNGTFGSWWYEDPDNVKVADIAKHTQMLLGGFMLGVGVVIGLFLVVLLALLLALHFVRKRRIARDQHYDWGFSAYNVNTYYKSPCTPATRGLQKHHAGAGAKGRQLSPSPKSQQSLDMQADPAASTLPLEEFDANEQKPDEYEALPQTRGTGDSQW